MPAAAWGGDHQDAARRGRRARRHGDGSLSGRACFAVAELEQTRVVSPQGLVSFVGNHYSVPPGLAGAHVTVRIRLGEDDLHVVTAGRAIIAHLRRAPDGAGLTIRDARHVIALERAVLASFSDRAPCRTKARRPRPLRPRRKPRSFAADLIQTSRTGS
ncbi:Mu transposase domain-containing protein [Streptomyces sp. NBC_01439]|uniref:Mu transposase domain-containing protein n=1 Tax=Streptomyces sp. NBC_01439 TaxID=2903867 RepID=UPI003FCD124C